MSFWEKIYLNNQEKLTQEILAKYIKNKFAIIDFIYFATIIEGKLTQKNKEEKYQIYEKALQDCDFLLPDGIALKLVYKKHFHKNLENLNGTDFMPYFLDSLKNQKINLVLYGSLENFIEKAKDNLEKKYPNINIVHFQDGYKELQREKINISDDNKINILLVGRGSPRQENWAYQNKEKLKKFNFLVFNVGGLLDFWAGREKRAPEIIRKFKGERVWRFVLNPKKNYKKFLQSFVFLHFLLKKKL